MHFYILDFPAKSFREIMDLPLTRDFCIVGYDAERLVILRPPPAEPKSDARELVVIDIAAAHVADRFVLKNLSHLFFGPIGRSADGWIVINASRLGDNNERLYIHGIARIHPLTRDIAFEVFSRERTGLWEMPLPASVRVIWQPDEAAFWWIEARRAICVGIDGRTSPPIRFDTNRFYTFVALADRVAEATGERETVFETTRLNGSPSDDLSPVDAPAPAVITPSAADMKRQKNAQTALKKIVSEKSDLRFTVKTADAQDVAAAIDAITAALDKGLAWFGDGEGKIKLAIKIDGVTYDEKKRFFAHVETLGAVAAPALTRLLAKVRMDPDFAHAWSGEREDGQQAFGAAAKALAGIDPGAWVELAAYEMCVDDYHELYFRNEVVPHFVKTHGWREESFALALADLVHVRNNMGDDYTYAWRRSGLAAAAEAAYSPASFAALMLVTRDRMLSAAAGTFATYAKSAAAAPLPVYGWSNYDRLFDQIKGSMTMWETVLFRELKQKSGA